ncbi:MAG TPA: SDR family oxidoreductase [Polyangiaceae bacterium]|jgi:NAD(P)-dependent dehydrogenase (short-subunit alcohol dehydrogenase family)|nr:SDR family oxidoreductase [Polyangiaceae bacterium]
MLLKNKNAVIYGAGGAVGGAVARAFAREGARVFLAGRHRAPVAQVVEDIVAAGGVAEAAHVDAMDERAVEEHAAAVAKKAGSLDVSFNAITAVPQPGTQGIPIIELSVESFTAAIEGYARSHFLTARAAARRMVAQRSGVILMHTPEPGRLGAPLVGGMGPAWAAMEALNRNLSAELAPHGVRAVCIRSTGLPETATIDVVYGLHARALGLAREQFQALLEGMSHRKRQTTLAEVADAAVFLASDRASAMTGTVANLTGGMIVD